ncbi:MAG: mandelate racemase/muconate lactonizing enzyme family protein [Chloroflexota bacterium]
MRTISRVEVLTAALPFRFSFGHALASRASSTNVFVKLTLDDGSFGLGEGVPREYVTGETVDSSVVALGERFAPALIGRHLRRPGDVPELIGEVTNRAASSDGVVEGATRCALELALLDAAGKAFGLPVSHWLTGRTASRVRYTLVIPFSSPRRLAAIASLGRAAGIVHVKVKVGDDIDADLAALRLLRRVFGPKVDIRVDANCAWTADQALDAIERMRVYRISGVEQPVPGQDLNGLRRVTAGTKELIIVDESVRTVDEARELAATGACDAFNIRVSKCGGLLNSHRIAQVAAAAGMPCVVGAQVGESVILSMAGRHLAAAIGARYVEGSAGRILLKNDLSRDRVLPGRGGWARVPEGPGLGMRVNEDALRKDGQLRHVVEASSTEKEPAI